MLDFYTFSHFQKYDALLHAVTTKSSLLPYSFSLALHTGENKQSIIENREKTSEYFFQKFPLQYIVANQTHSDHIHIVNSSETKGWKTIEDAISDCDALITNISNIMLTILTADCVPILLYDKEKRVIAAVHAGWKGTKAHIVSKTVEKMIEHYQSQTKDIIVGIAPSIGRCCYEVDNDVAKHFSDTPKGYTVKKDKYILDLPYINKQQLLDVGILEENIEMSNICTSCEVDRFFSYRKEQGCSGRFMSMIGLKDNDEN